MKTIIKTIITLIIFYILFTYIDIDSVVRTIKDANIFYIFLALLAQFLSTYLAAYRWRLIMKLLDFKERVSYYVQSYFKGSFFNQLLPSSIGGDAIRILELGQHGYSKKEAFYGILVDRAIGLVGLVILNLIANLSFYKLFPLWLFQLINMVTVATILGFLILMNLKKLHFLSSFKILDLFYRLSKRMNKLYHSKKTLMLHLLLSMVVHMFSILAVYALALSVNLNLDFDVFLVAIPPIFLLTIIPISLAGWGVRESAMVGILVLVGAAKSGVLAISILYGLILIISSLPGAYFWTMSKKRI